MRSLASPRLEATAIRSLTAGSEKIAGWLMPRLNAEHFSFDPCRDFHKRLSVLTRKDGEIPRWEDLIEDMAISEDSREELTQNPGGLIETKREAELVVKRLDEYRRARVVFRMARTVSQRLRAETFEVDDVVDEAGEMLSLAHGKGTLEESSFSFGLAKMDKRALREVLEDTRDEFLPTGFKRFDTENQGVPRGSLWMMAGQTGAGKSVMAMSVAKHQAAIGYRVALISLEMGRKEIVRRLLSSITAIPLAELNRISQDPNDPSRRRIIEAYREYNDRVHRNGGRLLILTPDGDVSIEDLLTWLRPRGFDNTIIDYMGLLKGMDGEDQWRQLGAAARYGKRYTAHDNSVVTLLAQLSAEGMLRYSRTMQEHASLMWAFTRTLQERESNIISVQQPKARNLKDFTFQLETQYHIMRLVDVDAERIIGDKRNQTTVKARKPEGPVRRGAITLSGGNESASEYQL